MDAMPADITAGPKTATPRNANVWPLLLLFLAGLINFFDRSSLGVAATSIRADLHLSATEIGALLSVFSLAYGLAQLPLAALLKPANARAALGFGLLLWSAAQAASGAVHRFGSFLLLRIALGAGESPFYPSGVHTVRENTSGERRGRATALLNLAAMLGLAMAPPLLTVLMLHFGWRGMFFILGGAGGALAILWLLTGKARDVTAETNRPGTGLPFAALLQQRTMWGMMLGFGGLNYVNWFYISWLPGYLETGRHLSVRNSGWLAAAPFLAGACGALASGVFTDALGERGAPRERLHRRSIIGGLLCCGASTALVESMSSSAGAVALMCVAMFFLHFAGTSGWGLIQVMAPAESVPAATALQNFGSFMIASLAPLITGWLLDRTHSFAIALLLCGGMAASGALCYATLTTQPMRSEGTGGAQ